MFSVKSVDETFRILYENFSDYDQAIEIVAISNACGRVTAGDIISGEDIPSFRKSSVDGYAVIASDTFGAGEALPAQLKLMGEVRMGESPAFTIKSGQAVYVPTGGEVPEGADSVVMIEFTEDLEDGFIYVNKPVAPGASLVLKGDDTRAGSVVLKANSRLRPMDIGALAALGIEKLEVKKKLRVGVISTGDEIVGISEQLTGSKVRDVNSYLLASGITEYEAEAISYGIVKDNYSEIYAVAEKALSECDMVLISGGSSVGTRDETAKVIEALGTPGVLVHGIAVKPGKPTIIGKAAGKPVIGLPGHPVSAYFIFRIFVTRLMDIMNRLPVAVNNHVTAKMSVKYPSNAGREEYIPVRIKPHEKGYIAEPIFVKSALITMLTAADGYVHLSRGSEGINSGDEVAVELF